METEKIGIVPKGIFPRYCDSLFPNENVIDFMNLPYEERDRVVSACKWQPLRKVTLLED